MYAEKNQRKVSQERYKLQFKMCNIYVTLGEYGLRYAHIFVYTACDIHPSSCTHHIGGGASRRPRKRYTLKKPQSRSKCKKQSATSSQPIFPSCVKVVNPPWRALFKRVLYHHPITQSQILLHISKI